MSEERVYIEQVDVLNIGGIDEFHATLGAINLVIGENGAGKTSFCQALDIVFAGGTDPDLIRNGADSGEITLTLNDGTTIRKVIKRSGADVTIKTKDGGKVKREAEYLRTLAAGMGFDPIGFLDAEPKERADFLLKHLPLTFTAAEINEAIGTPVATSEVTLQKLNELRDGKYNDRAELNKKVRDLEGTINDMRGMLPHQDKDWGAERDRVEGEISLIASEITGLAAQIELEAEQERSKKREWASTEIARIQKDLADHLAAVDKAAASSLAECTSELEQKRAALSLYLGTARTNADRQQQAEGVRQTILKRESELQGHISTEMRLTKAIKRMDELKHAKLKELPIEGLDLRMDKGKPIILVDGVTIDKLNRQQQLFIAMQAVTLASGKLPLIICEASELDDNHLSELTGVAKDAGLQLVLARWQNDAALSVVSS